MSNRLAASTSPYLLQHATNPVDWWEWGEDAFAEARDRDVPILLSVGYASCHWCHVMAHESFEDAATAALMNDWFVNIKVDREERPDVDRVYMDAVQAMSGGRGGWPMTVFLTASGEPFHAGTYYPKTDRPGYPSFRRVMEAVRVAWQQRRSDLEEHAAHLSRSVAVAPPPVDAVPTEAVLHEAYRSLSMSFDRRHGGFGGAPKFPQVPILEFLLGAVGRSWAPEAELMVTTTLDAMADGGIRDHVDGGFSRYSVDEKWLVPHFEKMLYDNALLARLYALAWQVTRRPGYAEVARTTLDYMLRDLGLPEGGFASGEDADSEGEEGRFHVFGWNEFCGVTESAAVAEVLGVTETGNFEGRSIVHRAAAVEDVADRRDIDTEDLARQVSAALEGLAELRHTRVRPGLDDKAVCAWNGLAIKALADAGTALHEPRYLSAAERTAHFVLEYMRRPDGRLVRAWRAGRSSGPGFCDDYAAVAVGLFALYSATGDAMWFAAGEELTKHMVELFWDDDAGGFYATGSDAETLIARPKNQFDNPTPSDNALAAEALQHLAALTGDTIHLERLERTIRAAGRLLEHYPSGGGHMLSVLQVLLEGAVEVAIVGTGPARADLIEVLRSRYRPGVFAAFGDGVADHGIPLLRDRPAGRNAQAFVCRGFVCDAPVSTPQELEAALKRRD